MQLFLTLAGIFVAVGILYLGVVALILYFSLKPLRIHQYVSPGMLGYRQEAVSFETSDGLSLSGWWSEGDGDVVAIAAHGYVMNRCEWVPVQSFMGDAGYSFLYFDLRAHGRSEGARIGFGRDETADVLAAIAWVRSRVPGKKIVLLGSSMGAVASVRAAKESPEGIVGLILDGPYRNLEEAMAGWWPFLGGNLLAKVMRPSKWIAPWILGFAPKTLAVDDSLKEIHDIPTILIYGGADPLISAESIQAMKEAAGEHGTLVMFDGATHGAGRLQDPEKFKKELVAFLDEAGLWIGLESD